VRGSASQLRTAHALQLDVRFQQVRRANASCREIVSDNFTLCAGGKVAVFDLRRAAPLVVKDHMYDAPIKDIKFHTATGDHTGQQRVISADSHIVKVRLLLLLGPCCCCAKPSTRYPAHGNAQAAASCNARVRRARCEGLRGRAAGACMLQARGSITHCLRVFRSRTHHVCQCGDRNTLPFIKCRTCTIIPCV
jgi:hypothetical protein